jgi:putative sigma-54 modulation protein
MRYEFTGRHITVTPALKKHTREHLDKLDKILDSAPMMAHVILDVEKHRQTAEIVLTWRDHTFKAAASTKDMYDSITQASDKIETQIFRLKDRFAKSKRGKLPMGTAAATIAPARPAKPAEAAAASNNGPESPRIVRTRRYTVKPMTPEEAASEIAASREQFVVFRDAETNRTGVIYKRKDGHFGLIEP